MMSIPQVAGALYLFIPLPERGRLTLVAPPVWATPPVGAQPFAYPDGEQARRTWQAECHQRSGTMGW